MHILLEFSVTGRRYVRRNKEKRAAQAANNRKKQIFYAAV
jgi:hypothetical protein